jgi:hypothetical protein
MAGRISYYGGIVTQGLVLDLDAGKRDSYVGTGTAWNDISGNRNNGTLVNGITFDTENDGSIVFDGTNDYVNLGTSNALKFTRNFTLSLWLKFNSTNNGQTIISNNEAGGYGIIYKFGSSTKIETWYYINGSYRFAGDEASNYTLGSWYYITSTFDGVNINFYRNGNLIQTLNAPGNVTTTNEPLTLAANPNTGGTAFQDFFNGNISIVHIYNKSLSASEVLQNYNATKGRFGL